MQEPGPRSLDEDLAGRDLGESVGQKSVDRISIVTRDCGKEKSSSSELFEVRI